MNRLRCCVDFTLGIQVVVKITLSQPSPNHFYTGNFDYSVPLRYLKASGLGIEKNQSRHQLPSIKAKHLYLK
jgi:hypothetical protein